MPDMQRPTLGSASFGLVIGTLAGAALLLLAAPTLVVLVTSFTDGYSLKFPPPSYSLRWYASLIDAWQLQDAALVSLKLGAVVTAVSVVLGTAAALAIGRSRRAWARGLDALFMSPLVLPALAFGLASLVFFSTAGVELSFLTLAIGHIVVSVPYVLRTTLASLAQLDPALLESSESLGAGRVYTFRRVTLPTIRNGIGAGAFIAFMSSFDNIPVSLFMADARNEVLPIRMWQILENSLDVRAAAVSGVLIAVTVLAMVVMERVAGLSRQLR